MPNLLQIGDILERGKAAAVDYYQLTGKPLGITGEIGEYLAAKHLGLELADARNPGYDATDPHESGWLDPFRARLGCCCLGTDGQDVRAHSYL